MSKQPINQFYDEHWREDNPALRCIIMDASQFIPMLERRGFSLAMQHSPGRDYFAVNCAGVPISIAEEFFQYQTVAEVARQLDRLVGMHHVCCAKCQEPLLEHKYTDQAKALKLFRAQAVSFAILEVEPGKAGAVLYRLKSTLPVSEGDAKLVQDQRVVDEILVQATIVEYRSAKAGAQSAAITECIGCGVTLSREMIEEIRDDDPD